MTDQDLCDAIVAENRYLAGKVLPDGSIAVVMRLITTTAIALGVNRESWSRRFCFQDPVLCMQEFDKLETEDDEPKGWIARRPEMPCDRLVPEPMQARKTTTRKRAP